MSIATRGAITEYLPLLRHRPPDEGENQLAPLLGRLAPIALLHFSIRNPVAAVPGVQQQRIRSLEHLLPSQSVADYQNHVLCLPGKGRRDQSSQYQQAEQRGELVH